VNRYKASGSGGLADGNLWFSGGVGAAIGGVSAYLLGLPSFFSGSIGMEVLGYGVFVLAGLILGLIVGSLLLRPDAH
jgi:hypothetical protein